MKKTIVSFLCSAALLACTTQPKEPEKIVCAYMTHSVNDSIDAQHINRLIYSYIYIDSTLTSVVVQNPERLAYAASLRNTKPELEVMMSFGGNPGKLSRTMRNDSLRALVVADCKRVIDSYGLDGIDIDWEFPGRGEQALSEEEDVANYVKLLSDLRNALGKDKIITIACAGSGYGVDFKAMAEIIDQFNIMAYDMGTPPSHHSALYNSERVGWLSSDQSVRNFIEGGVPASKIVLGMPFYGRGIEEFGNFVDWRDIRLPQGAVEQYDSIAKVPWIADSLGRMILTYDNPASLRLKCDYIKANKLAGGMYWRIEEDDSNHSLARAVAEGLSN